jgi:hypothetical protein
MYKFLLLILGFLLLGCSRNNSINMVSKKHISKIESQIKADSTKDEDFLSFFEQFKKDTLFQRERICLPFELIITVEDDGAGVTCDSTIIGNDKRDWPFCSFLIDDSISYYHQDMVVNNDTIEVRLSQNPSSYDPRRIDAEFIRLKGKWKLRAMNNHILPKPLGSIK